MHGVFMTRVCDKCMNGARVYNIRRIVLIGVLLIVAAGVMVMLYKHMVIRLIVLLVLVLLAVCFRKNIFSVFTEMKKSVN